MARVNGKLEVLGLDFSGHEAGEGDTPRLQGGAGAGAGLPAYDSAGIYLFCMILF